MDELVEIAEMFAPDLVYIVGGSVRNRLLGLLESGVDICGAEKDFDSVRGKNDIELFGKEKDLENSEYKKSGIEPFEKEKDFRSLRGETDVDICGAMTPEEVVALGEKFDGLRVAPINPRIGTLKLIFKGREFEYTTFRRDNYDISGAHKPSGVVFTKDVEEDAKRRDFTVNAIYYEIASGKIIDPLNGVRDLKNRLLRACNKPRVTLSEDGLRLMRLVRFAAEYGFRIEEETLRAAKDCAALILKISGERVRDELLKILASDRFSVFGNGGINGEENESDKVFVFGNGGISGEKNEFDKVSVFGNGGISGEKSGFDKVSVFGNGGISEEENELDKVSVFENDGINGEENESDKVSVFKNGGINGEKNKFDKVSVFENDGINGEENESDRFYIGNDGADGEKIGPEYGLKLLSDLEILKYVIPELADCVGFASPNKYCKYDVFTHTVKTVAYAPKALRLAALFHDAGKPLCFFENGNTRSHAKYGAEIAEKRMGRNGMKFKTADINRVVKLVGLHMFDIDGKTEESNVRLFIQEHSEFIDDLVELKKADRKAKTGGECLSALRIERIFKEMKEQGTPFFISDLKINGDDLKEMGAKDREIGVILKKILRECANDREAAEKDKQFERAAALIKGGID
jgi:tRNA nucleotidyltransferase/poly(A) polymerase